MSRARKTLLMSLFFVLAGAVASEAATIVEYFIMGGWVMYPILVLSVVSWGITFERITVIMLQKYKLKVDKVITMFEESMKKNNGDKDRTAEEMVTFLRTKNSVFAQIMETLFQKYREGAEKRMAGTELKGWIQVSVESKAAVLMPRLERNLIGLAVISNVSTLMGLFGTVIGMIEAFTAMSKSAGGVKADEMAGGIAIALTATAGGLCVAVPSLILYNWVKSYVENYVITIEEASIIFIDTLVG